MTAGPQSPDASAEFIPGTVFEEVAPELTRNYAEALLNASGEEAEAVVLELEEIGTDVLDVQPRFATILASPSISVVEKDRILNDTFEGRALPTVVRFLRVLNRHGRLGLLTSVTRQARATLDRRSNRKPVTVRSAVALDEGQQSALRDRLASMINASPVISLEVAPSLIGGLVVQVGDEVYDASVRTRLDAIRGRLIERKTHEIQSRRDHFSYPA
ncbi:ATP synthase F1 subunit delta [Tundrisphaera lichenicola]|uniref:ATP synthase F1 subunit delta n=1 Tax=Tundrisphaera lichenicola TaxID=2029860 RepID=UPI003EBF26C6